MAKKKVLNPELNPLLIAKVVVFISILVSPFINYTSLYFLDNLFIKAIFIIIIVYFCFIDFQLAILSTIALMILIINLNNNMLVLSNNKPKPEMFGPEETLDSYFPKPMAQQHKDSNTDAESVGTHNLSCNMSEQNDINDDMLSFFIDEKIKQYDIYISMMTNKDNLEKAQGSHL